MVRLIIRKGGIRRCNSFQRLWAITNDPSIPIYLRLSVMIMRIAAGRADDLAKSLFEGLA